MSSILLFGASGAVGRFLLPRLSPVYRVVPVSRARSAAANWLQADLDDATVDWPATDIVISVGPLDAFVRWLERRHDPGLRRIVAVSSMSAVSKRDSVEAAERELAARLRGAERRLFELGVDRGIAVTVFRPTLIYGAGVDRSLAPIARFARRWRVLPVPAGATGLRQPLHARDLAAACVAALDERKTHGNTYELGGAERLSFGTMLRKLRACVRGPVLVVPVPLGVLRALAALFARRMPGRAAIARLLDPLVADNGAAQRDFGYEPGMFDGRDVLPP